MRTQKFTPSILALTFLFFLPFLTHSQTDFSKFNVFDDEIVEDIQLTSEQVTAISNLEGDCGMKRGELNKALLYHEDYRTEMDGVFDFRNAKISKILSEDQNQAYADRISGARNLRTHGERIDLKEKYLSEFSKYDITDKQAETLADAYLNWEQNPFMSRDKAMEEVMKEVFSKKQFKQYKKDRKRTQFGQIKMPNYSLNETDAIARMKFKNDLWAEKYIPQRQLLRDEIELLLTDEEKEQIAQLRADYDERIQKKYVSKNKYRKNLTSVSKDYFKAHKASSKFRAENLINRTPQVGYFLQSDRETFYLAKDLAVKYDGLIDKYENKLTAIEKEINREYAEKFTGRKYKYFPKPNSDKSDYPANKDEMYANIAFLLVDSDASKSNEIEVKKSVFKAYPMPARDVQTVEFELANDSEISLDLINAEGKVVKMIYSGLLSKGNHKYSVELNDINDKIYFYRLTTSESNSMIKSVKF